MINERLFEIVFGLSFVTTFIVVVMLFSYIGAVRPKTRDLNSPKYLGALLLGFLSGIAAETALSLFSEVSEANGLSWFWPYLAVELAAGTLIVAAIFFFLLKGTQEGQNPAS